jgi:serine/threonine-protein kinase mTOR
VDVWQRVLRVRGLVVSVPEDTEIWIKYANLCGKNGRTPLAYATLASIYGEDPERPRDPVRSPTTHTHRPMDRERER